MRRITYLLALAVLPGMALSAQNPARPAIPSSAEVEKRVDQIIGKLNLEQKIDLLGGVDGFFIRDFNQLGWPRLRMADGPIGVRNFGPSTAYAAGIGLAASWDPDLARKVGVALGQDARAKGVHFLLGPGVNIYRAPMNGRNFEYFGEDPWLASRTAVAYIQGVQSQGVIATVKHFMGNNSEFDRHGNNSQIDERTLREIYLPTFEAAVKEGKVGSIMDSYNFINGQHATQNGRLNTEIAKQEWGFRGIMMSDWGATYDGVAAANGGLDLEMPNGRFMNQKTLLPAIQEGTVSAATIDDKVRRILRTGVEFGFLDRAQKDLNLPRYNVEHQKAALQGAEEGMVLLKNQGAILPLKKTLKTIAVLGPAAYPAVPVGGGSAAVQPFSSVSGLEGIGKYLGAGAKVLYDRGVVPMEEILEGTQFFTTPEGGARPGIHVEYFNTPDCSGTPTKTLNEFRLAYESNEPIDWSAFSVNGVPKETSVRYTGYYLAKKTGPHHWFITASGRDTYKLFVNDELVAEHAMVTEGQGPAYTSTPLEAGKAYSVKFELGVGPAWGTNKVNVGVIASEDLVTPEAKQLAASADAAVVMVGYDPATESEGFDRTFELPGGQDELIQTVSAANKKTIVVLTAGGAVAATKWIDQVPALLHTWYPGQEGGIALAKVLFGEINPSGHLPMTWERRWEDNPVHDSYYVNNGEKNTKYTEGVFVGYRGYEKNGVKPLFPFGHGLSYTRFAYKNLKVSPVAPKLGQEVMVSFDITNTGKLAGADVPQLYVGDPSASVPRPVKELKGFQRVSLKPGETKHVALKLDARAMSFYDVEGKGWKQEPGKFTVLVGRSSADIALKGEYNVSR